MPFEQQVKNAWTAGWVIALILIAVAVLTHRSEDHGPMLWQVWRDRLIMFIERRAARRAASMRSVYIPVSQYGMDAAGMEEASSDAPDIDAQNAGMPRISRNITDGELIVLLAVIRGKNGKPRFSANAIVSLMGGDRNAILERVRELRAVPPPAEFMQPDGTKTPGSYPVSGRTA